jgi:two-component system response regulator AtoC
MRDAGSTDRRNATGAPGRGAPPYPSLASAAGDVAPCRDMRSKYSPRPDGALREFHGIYTAAPQMFALFERLPRVARSEASVLIRGETGTGKELVARALHSLSGRAKRSFQALNCATLTAELLASELFGHVRGAFTGAIRDRPGLFRQAHRGSIFLDEIAEMPLDIQARLLRVLQERSFTPLGGTEPVEVDVRVISATHKSLREEARLHRFREDLMYRVRVVPLFLPPLAERSGDVEALVWHFIDQFAAQGRRRIERIERIVMDALLGYPWPGNIRELRNAVERAMLLTESDTLLPDHFPVLTPRAQATQGVELPAGGIDLEQLERDLVVQALARTTGNQTRAAALLGLNRDQIRYRIEKFGLKA